MNKIELIDKKEQILQIIKNYPKKDIELVSRAADYCKQMHKGQKRYEGTDYYTHCFAVGKILADMKMSAVIIAAGLLHDTVEDTSVTVDDIKKNFSNEIAFLVDGLSKISDVKYVKLDTKIRSLQKLFIYQSKDIRVVLIKLVDRLHNMRTLVFVPKEKQKRIAEETLKVYVPIAGRLLLENIREELSELAFIYSDYENYKKIKNLVDISVKNTSIDQITTEIKKVLFNNNLKHFEIYSRVKKPASIYEKMINQEKTFDEIQDLFAFRIVVKELEDVYKVLGILHNNFRQVPNKFKDFISFPKPNGYQAVHTRIFFDKKIVEAQILTKDMYNLSKEGIISHFQYKADKYKNLMPNLKWFFNILGIKDSSEDLEDGLKKRIEKMYDREWSNNISDFKDDLESDFLKERMFIFTPEGEVIDLPKESTAADFAFAIHSDIGIYAKGAYINNKYKSISTELNNGDIVNIDKSKKAVANKKWFDWLKTTEARKRLRLFIERNS